MKYNRRLPRNLNYKLNVDTIHLIQENTQKNTRAEFLHPDLVEYSEIWAFTETKLETRKKTIKLWGNYTGRGYISF